MKIFNILGISILVKVICTFSLMSCVGIELF